MSITKIAELTATGSSGSLNFTSIPSSFTDLMLVLSLREATTTTDSVQIQFNGDTGNNYTARHLQGSGSGTNSFTDSSIAYIQSLGNGSGRTANTFGSASIYIPNCAGSTQKSVSLDAVNESNATAANQRLTAGLWSGTAAINAINIFLATGNWASGSTATLYGITKGSSGGVTVA